MFCCSNTDTNRRIYLVSAKSCGLFFKGGSKPFSRLHGICESSICQNGYKLLSPYTPDKIIGSKALTHCVGKVAEQGVTSLVAVGIVYIFKMVKIHHH